VCVCVQNIVNNHDAVDGGHAAIERALEGMVGVARSINEMRRQHESAVHVQEIQSHLYGWHGADLTTLGQLVLEVRCVQGHRSHGITGEGTIKEDWRSGGQKSPSGVKGQSPGREFGG